MKHTFLLFLGFELIFLKGFSQEPISITKNSVNTPPSFNDGVKQVNIQNNLIPYELNTIKPSNKRIENLPGQITQENAVKEIQESKNLVPIQEQKAFSSEKKIVNLTNTTPTKEPTYKEVIIKPVLLVPYSPNK